MAKDDAIPPIPAAPDGANAASDVPPVEPAPVAATPAQAPVEPAPVAPPVVGSGTIPASAMPPVDGAAAPVNPYADPAAPAPVAPQAAYAQPGYAQPGYAQPVAPGYPQPYAGGYAPTPPQGMSIASLVCGIAGVLLSLFSFGFLPALAAVILGHMAQKRQPHAKAMWMTGLVTGYIGIGISILWGIGFILAFVLPLIFIGSMGGFSG
jgi:hypothetical protein